MIHFVTHTIFTLHQQQTLWRGSNNKTSSFNMAWLMQSNCTVISCPDWMKRLRSTQPRLVRIRSECKPQVDMIEEGCFYNLSLSSSLAFGQLPRIVPQNNKKTKHKSHLLRWYIDMQTVLVFPGQVLRYPLLLHKDGNGWIFPPLFKVNCHSHFHFIVLKINLRYLLQCLPQSGLCLKQALLPLIH